jgi:uncharacterized protein YjiS (DUF1127 family)
MPARIRLFPRLWRPIGDAPGFAARPRRSGSGGRIRRRAADIGAGVLQATWGWWVERIASWRKHARDRRLLARRDDRLLRDIGLDRGAVEDESTTSFWRLP